MQWLSLIHILPSLKATVTRKPEVEEIPVQVNIQYVVEFYAR